MWGWLRRPASGPADTSHTEAAPQSYAQWSTWLDRLAQGDDDARCLAQLHQGQLSWSGGVAPLFVERISTEVQRRLGLCAERLTRNLRLGADESLVVRALLQARHELAFIHQLCRLPAVPESTRSQLGAEVRKFAERAQQSLLDTAQSDRSGRLASLLRHNALTRYANPPAQNELHDTPAPTTVETAAGAPRRRNILS